MRDQRGKDVASDVGHQLGLVLREARLAEMVGGGGPQGREHLLGGGGGIGGGWVLDAWRAALASQLGMLGTQQHEGGLA